MTRRLLITTALLATLLGGCSIHYHQTQACAPCTNGNSGNGDPAAPKVIISNGTITVDQDVLRFAKDQTKVTISWRLEGKGGRIGGRISPALIEKAKARTGIETDTDLIAFALANIAVEDRFAESFKAVRGAVDADLNLGF